jgi:ABC-type transporter Mla MlaB component
VKIYKEETVAHLKGDLTQDGVIYDIINLLSVSLQRIVSGGDHKIRIDCDKIRKADIKGLQLLFLWMQSAKSRGVEPELINLSRNLRQSMKKMGFDFCFKIISIRKDAPDYINKERRAELCFSV